MVEESLVVMVKMVTSAMAAVLDLWTESVLGLI